MGGGEDAVASPVAPALSSEEEARLWIEERKKRFPSAAVREAAAIASEGPDSASVEGGIAHHGGEPLLIAGEGATLEDGAVALEPGEERATPLRHCKYFRRGKCNNGEGCTFVHLKRGRGDPLPQREAAWTTRPSLLALLDARDQAGAGDAVESCKGSLGEPSMVAVSKDGSSVLSNDDGSFLSSDGSSLLPQDGSHALPQEEIHGGGVTTARRILAVLAFLLGRKSRREGDADNDDK